MAKARVVLPRQVIAACNGMGGGIGLGRLVARVLGACRSGEEEGGGGGGGGGGRSVRSAEHRRGHACSTTSHVRAGAL